MPHFHFLLITGPILAIAVGRRWTQSGLHVSNAVLFFIVMLLAPSSFINRTVRRSVQVLCLILKINIAASLTVGYLQAVELFPTGVRMSGMGLCHIVSQVCWFSKIDVCKTFSPDDFLCRAVCHSLRGKICFPPPMHCKLVVEYWFCLVLVTLPDLKMMI